MLVETKLKHAAIVIDQLDHSLAAAIVEYAVGCGLEVLDFYVTEHAESQTAIARSAKDDEAVQYLRNGLARNDIQVSFIDNSGTDPARKRLVSKIQALTKQDLDYESFVEALVPSPPDLIIVAGDKLANRVIEEASYAELVFLNDLELDSIKSAFAEFVRRKRNFGV